MTEGHEGSSRSTLHDDERLRFLQSPGRTIDLPLQHLSDPGESTQRNEIRLSRSTDQVRTITGTAPSFISSFSPLLRDTFLKYAEQQNLERLKSTVHQETALMANLHVHQPATVTNNSPPSTFLAELLLLTNSVLPLQARTSNTWVFNRCPAFVQ